MTMLITKFNKMIHRRALWAAFAVIVSIAFVGAYSQMSGAANNNQTAGRIFDREISREKFQKIQMYVLELQNLPDITPEIQRLLRSETWKTIASLEFADKLGLKALPEEVKEILRQDPSFQENGVFNPEKYRQVTRSRNLSVPLYEDYIKYRLTMAKLQSLMESAVWISPLEAQRKVQDFTDLFTVDCALLPMDNFKQDQEVTEPEIESFYSENRQYFTKPKQVSVKYVAFAYSNMLAETKIPIEDIESYYTDNPQIYTTTNPAGEEISIPFETVTNEIENVLKRQEARYLAEKKADEMISRLTSLRAEDPGQSFIQLAKTYDLPVYTSSLFIASETLPETGTNLVFTESAFNLAPGSLNSSVSDPIRGSDSVYVQVLHNSKPEHIPELNDIYDEVKTAAIENKQQEKMVESLIKARESIVESLSKDKPFETSVSLAGGSIVTSFTFSAYSENVPDYEHFDAIMQNTINLKTGEVTELIPNPDGAILAHVSQRSPGDPGSIPYVKSQIQVSLSRYRAGSVFKDWQNSLLEVGNLDDQLPEINEDT